VTTKLINLLPKEEKKRDVRSIVLNVFVVLVIILFLTTILLTFFLFDIDNLLSSRLSEYEGTNIKVQDQVNKLKIYSDFRKNTDDKSDILEDLKKNELYWSRVLYDIGKLMPEDAYAVSFEARGSQLYSYIEEYKEGEVEEGRQVISFTINGQAASYMDVLKLSIELKKIENVEAVWIENITRTVVQGIDLEIVSFTINTYWKLDNFTGDIEKKTNTQDEDILDEEISDI
jgi:hypothetical protein